MASREYRIFFDTSVYITALLSPEGAAGKLIHLVEGGIVRMVVSEEVIVEVDRVLLRKFPSRVEQSRELLKRLEPEIALTPTMNPLKPFLAKLPEGDAAILCSAGLAKVSAFVTWNTRDFMAPGIASLVHFPIVIPAEALKLFREWVEPFLE